MTEDEIAKLFPRLAALPLEPRPAGEGVDRSIKKADTRTDPKLIERFGRERGPAVIWDEANKPVPVNQEEEIPE